MWNKRYKIISCLLRIIIIFVNLDLLCCMLESLVTDICEALIFSTILLYSSNISLFLIREAGGLNEKIKTKICVIYLTLLFVYYYYYTNKNWFEKCKIFLRKRKQNQDI